MSMEERGGLSAPAGAELPDSLIDRYFDEGPDTAGEGDADPVGEAETVTDEGDTPEGDSLDFDDETEAEADGDAQSGGQDEDEDGEDSPEAISDDEIDDILSEDEDESPEEEEDDPEIEDLLKGDEDDGKDTDSESFLPEFDRKKFLEEHPELEAPYKHFQAAFTRKMQELGSQRQEVETVKSEYDSFINELRTDEGAEKLLVQVALQRPEVMEKAYERMMRLNEDEGEKESYLREQELEKREKRLSKQEQAERVKQQQARVEEVVGLTERTAGKLGLSGRELEIAERFVTKAIYENRAKTGKPEISDREVVLAVKDAADVVKSERKRMRGEIERQVREESKKSARKKARSSKRPKPPKSRTPSGEKVAKERKFNSNRDIDPIDSLVDDFLGVD